MVVANENNLFARLKNGAEFKRNELFDTLVKGSQRFLKGGKGMVMDGTLENTTYFGFWMEGYWQGKYDKYLKVSKDGRASTEEEADLKSVSQKIFVEQTRRTGLYPTAYHRPALETFDLILRLSRCCQ